MIDRIRYPRGRGVIPTVYGDALSYVEMVGKVSEKCNEVIDFVNDFDKDMQVYVDNWLNAHPEATTTVLDHSLTNKKLVIGTLDFVTPEMFGAYGDGEHDDTVAIQEAIDVGKIVIFNGTYLVSLNESNIALNVKNDTILYLNNSTIKLDTNLATSYKLINIDNKENVKIINGNIEGDKLRHSGSSNEWCFGVYVSSSNNVTIDNCLIKYNRGDGIYVGNGTCENITIVNNVLVSNGRNGISITDGENVNIDNNIITNTNGYAPQYGIGIEQNNTSQKAININISNCNLVDNEYGGFYCSLIGSNSSVNISNCNSSGGFKLEAYGTDSIINADNIINTPYHKVQSQTSEWAYQIDKGLTVGCNTTSSINVNNYTVNCENECNSLMMFAEGNSNTPHCNISVSNFKAINGESERISYDRTSGLFKNNNITLNVICDITTEATISSNNNIANDVKLIRNAEASGNLVPFSSYCEIVDGASTNLSISIWYGYEMIVYNKDDATHNLINATFTDGTDDTNSLSIGANKAVKLKLNILTNKIYYEYLN